jgi:hypothetical protein
MKKTISIFFLIILAAVCLTFAACADRSGGDNGGDDDKSGEQTETVKPAAATFVGAYSKVNAMGLLQGVQVLTLYGDGTLRIYCGFTSAMGGYASDTYSGEYSLTEKEGGNEILASYTVGENTHDFTVNVLGGKFRTQIYMIMNMPDDETNEGGVPGLTFYQTETVSLAFGAEYYYAGTLKHNACIYAYCMALNEDKSFSAYISSDGVFGVVSGSYEIKKGRTVLDDDNIIFTYDIKAIGDGMLTSETVLAGAKCTSNFNDDNAFTCFFKIGDVEAEPLNISVIRFFVNDTVRPTE